MCRGPEPPSLPLLPVAHLLISPAAEVVEGQGVTLSCRSGLSPTPDIRFSWYRNGALLHQGPHSSLQLTAASSTDAGSYHCQAEDGHTASGPSSPAILTVLCEQSSHQPLPAVGRVNPLEPTSHHDLPQALLPLPCPALGSRSGRQPQVWAPCSCLPRTEMWGTRLGLSLPPHVPSLSLSPSPYSASASSLKCIMDTTSKLCLDWALGTIL